MPPTNGHVPAGVDAAAAVHAAADLLDALGARDATSGHAPSAETGLYDALPEVLALGHRGYLPPAPAGEDAPPRGWWLGRCGEGALGVDMDGRLLWRPDALTPAETLAPLLAFLVAAFGLLTAMFTLAPRLTGGEAPPPARAAGFAGLLTLALFVAVMKGAQAYVATAVNGRRGPLDRWVRRWRPWRAGVGGVDVAVVHRTVRGAAAWGRAELQDRLVAVGEASDVRGPGEP